MHAARGTRILISLLGVYLLGGANYIAVAFGLESLPPFGMLAMRFAIAAVILALVGAIWDQAPLEKDQMMGAISSGLFLIAGTFAGIVIAQERLDAGLVAAIIATAPLWAALMTSLSGGHTSLREWLGMVIGLAGLVFLAMEGTIRATPVGALAALAGAMSLAAGSLLVRRFSASSSLTTIAIQMTTGSALFTLLSIGLHEPAPITTDRRALLALLFQAVFCSAVAFSLLNFLIRSVPPAIAMSFAYVNPVVAVFLGALLLAEPITAPRLAAIGLTLLGVMLLTGRLRGRATGQLSFKR